jgi:hypothetical protein
MAKDCSDYDGVSCPKGITVVKELTGVTTLNTIMVGCWGVYCWDGEVNIKEWKGLKDSEDLPEDVEKLFDKGTEIYGQKSVVAGMRKYAEEKGCVALFLAGDNVYNFMVPKPVLEHIAAKAIRMKNKGMLPTKGRVKLDPELSGQDINKQFVERIFGMYACTTESDVYFSDDWEP